MRGGTSDTVDLSSLGGDATELDDHTHTADDGGIVSYEHLINPPEHDDLVGSNNVDAHHAEMHDHDNRLIPDGGTIGQILTKTGIIDYATEWEDAPEGTAEYELEDHDHSGNEGDGGQISHDDLEGSDDDDAHHSKTHTHVVTDNVGLISYDDLTDTPTILDPDHTVADHTYFSGDYVDVTNKPTAHSAFGGGDEDSHHDRQHDSSDHDDNYSAEDHTHDATEQYELEDHIHTDDDGGTVSFNDLDDINIILSINSEDELRVRVGSEDSNKIPLPIIDHDHDDNLADHDHIGDEEGDGGIISYDDLDDLPELLPVPSVDGDYVLNLDSGTLDWIPAPEGSATTVAVSVTDDNELTVTVNEVVSNEVALDIPNLPDAKPNIIDTVRYVLEVPQTSGDSTWEEHLRPNWDATMGDAHIENVPDVLRNIPSDNGDYVLNVDGMAVTWSEAESSVSGDSRITYEDRAPTRTDTGDEGDLWIDYSSSKAYILSIEGVGEDAVHTWINEVNELTLEYAVESSTNNGKLVLRDHNDMVQAEYVLFKEADLADADSGNPSSSIPVISPDTLVGSSTLAARADHGHLLEVVPDEELTTLGNLSKIPIVGSFDDNEYTGNYITFSSLLDQFDLLGYASERGDGTLYIWSFKWNLNLIELIINSILDIIEFIPEPGQIIAVGNSPSYDDSIKLYRNRYLAAAYDNSEDLGNILTAGSGYFNSDGTVQEYICDRSVVNIGSGLSSVDTAVSSVNLTDDDRVLILPDSAASVSDDYVGHYVTVANLIPDIPEDIPAVYIQTSGQIDISVLDPPISAGDFYLHTGNSLFGIPEQIRLYIDSSSYVSIPPLAGNSASDNSNIDYIGAHVRSTSTVSMADVAAPVSHSHGEVTLSFNNDTIELKHEGGIVIANVALFNSMDLNIAHIGASPFAGSTSRAAKANHRHRGDIGRLANALDDTTNTAIGYGNSGQVLGMISGTEVDWIDVSSEVDLSTLDLRVTGGQIQLYDDTTEIAVVDIDLGDLGNISSTERELSFLGFGSTTTTASWIQPQFHVTGGELLLRDSNILGNVYARIDIADIGSGVVLVESDNSSAVNTSRIGKNNNTGEHENAARADHVHQGIIDLMRADVEAGTAGQFLKRSTDSSTSDVEWADINLTTDAPGSSLEDDDRFLFINTTQRTNFDLNYSGGFITYSLLLTELESDLTVSADFSELGLRLTGGNLKLDNGTTELDSLRILATPNTVLPEPITISTLQTTIVGDSTTLAARANHTHTLPSSLTSTISLSTTVTPGDIGTDTPNISVLIGTGLDAARSDHNHQVTYGATVEMYSGSLTNNNQGIVDKIARIDHRHVGGSGGTYTALNPISISDSNVISLTTNSILASHIAEDAVGASEINANAVGTSELNTGASTGNTGNYLQRTSSGMEWANVAAGSIDVTSEDTLLSDEDRFLITNDSSTYTARFTRLDTLRSSFLTSSITPGDIGTDTTNINTLVGDSTFGARANHFHQVNYGETNDMYVGSDTDNNQGSTDEIARIDHRHTSNGITYSTTALFLGADSSDDGDDDTTSRGDHIHGINYGETEDMYDGSLTDNNQGSVDEVARIDHRHEGGGGGGGDLSELDIRISSLQIRLYENDTTNTQLSSTQFLASPISSYAPDPITTSTTTTTLIGDITDRAARADHTHTGSPSNHNHAISDLSNVPIIGADGTVLTSTGSGTAWEASTTGVSVVATGYSTPPVNSGGGSSGDSLLAARGNHFHRGAPYNHIHSISELSNVPSIGADGTVLTSTGSGTAWEASGGGVSLATTETPGDIGTDTSNFNLLVGNSLDAARADHNHQVDYGETSDMYSGSNTDNNQGIVDEIARIDHRHVGGSGGTYTASSPLIISNSNVISINLNSITSNHISSGAVGSDEIAAGAVGTSELTANAVTNDKMANNSIGLLELNAGTGNNNQYLQRSGSSIRWETVGSSTYTSISPILIDSTTNIISILTNGITNSHLATNSVGSLEIASNAVGSPEINASGSSGFLQLSSGSLSWVAGGTGNYTAGSGLTLLSNQFSITTNGIQSSHIATNAVGSSELNSNSVGVSELNTGASTGNTGQFLQRISSGMRWASSSASGSFLGLSDTPDSFSSHAGDFVAINSTADDIEFVSPPGVVFGINSDTENISTAASDNGSITSSNAARVDHQHKGIPPTLNSGVTGQFLELTTGGGTRWATVGTGGTFDETLFGIGLSLNTNNVLQVVLRYDEITVGFNQTNLPAGTFNSELLEIELEEEGGVLTGNLTYNDIEVSTSEIDLPDGGGTGGVTDIDLSIDTNRNLTVEINESVSDSIRLPAGQDFEIHTDIAESGTPVGSDKFAFAKLGVVPSQNRYVTFSNLVEAIGVSNAPTFSDFNTGSLSTPAASDNFIFADFSDSFNWKRVQFADLIREAQFDINDDVSFANTPSSASKFIFSHPSVPGTGTAMRYVTLANLKVALGSASYTHPTPSLSIANDTLRLTVGTEIAEVDLGSITSGLGFTTLGHEVIEGTNLKTQDRIPVIATTSSSAVGLSYNGEWANIQDLGQAIVGKARDFINNFETPVNEDRFFFSDEGVSGNPTKYVTLQALKLALGDVAVSGSFDIHNDVPLGNLSSTMDRFIFSAEHPITAPGSPMRYIRYDTLKEFINPLATEDSLTDITQLSYTSQGNTGTSRDSARADHRHGTDGFAGSELNHNLPDNAIYDGTKFLVTNTSSYTGGVYMTGAQLKSFVGSTFTGGVSTTYTGTSPIAVNSSTRVIGLLSNSITATHLAADSVGASEIATNAVGLSELNTSNSGSTNQYLQRTSSGMSWATVGSNIVYSTTVELVDSDSSTPGTDSTVSRGDHRHGINYGETSDMYSGSNTDNNQGTVDEVARIDHRHTGGGGGGVTLTIPTNTTTSLIAQLTASTFGNTGTSSQASRANHRHGLGSILSSNTPIASTSSGGTSGISSAVSRSDHRHQAPAGGGDLSGLDLAIVFGDSNLGLRDNGSFIAGSAIELFKTSGSTSTTDIVQTISSTSGTTGTSTSAARSDHRHGLGTTLFNLHSTLAGFYIAHNHENDYSDLSGGSSVEFPLSNSSGGVTVQTYSASGNSGTLESAARSDHRHGSSGYAGSELYFPISISSIDDDTKFLATNHLTRYDQGTYVTGATLATFASDIRIKRNVEDLPNNLEQLNALRPVKYNLFSNNSKTISKNKTYGFIAQELVDVIPDVVRAEDKDCEDCKQGLECKSHDIWGIHYNSIVTMLVKSIQELSAQNDKLIGRIEALEGY